MIRGFLSPTSKLNCQNWFPGSPSNKSLGSPSLDDSFSSLNYSQMMQSQTINPKYNSFKKLKAQRIRQKNQQGKIIKQMVFKNKANYRIHALDQAKTIQSRNSPRSSISLSKAVIEESVIIMSGQKIDNMTKLPKQQFSNAPEMPSFKKRNTCKQNEIKKTDFLKPMSANPPLLKSIQTGLLFHYEIVKKSSDSYNNLMNIRHEGVLQIYSTIPLNSCACQITMVIYQPFIESLNEHILKKETVSFRQLINYMIDIVKILTHLRNICIFPCIQPTTVVMTSTNIKIKIRGQQNESNQRSIIRQCGYYFSSLIKGLNSYNIGPQVKKQKRIPDLTINKRLRFQNLMQQFIRMQQYTLDEAYLKLQTIQF